MSYTVLARKYRPQSFDDLVGQEHVARTLANAIKGGRVAHAFLFTGARGVGKTTTARLLAKALNCEQGPTDKPCNTCSFCVGITSGTDLDVLEMDGASNNSVEDVRRLQESIPYRPSRARFKVIIVDEVHMLSTGAFNAFLKTLEEPPPHVKFVFATTESHKVPITIRSRCQRYDFRLIPQSTIAARVSHILSLESLKADDEAVAIVAREAAGSMRDALTLLDQLLAFGGDALRGKEVAATLGIAGREQLQAAARAIVQGDGAMVLGAVDALANQGVDMLHFGRQLLGLVRDLVVLRVAGDSTELVDLVDDERRFASELAASVEPLELQRAFAAMSLLVEEVGKATWPRTVLEMGLVRIATRPALRGMGELIERLEELEKRIAGGGGGGKGAGPASRGPVPTGRPTGAGASPVVAAAPAPAPIAPTASAPPAAPAPVVAVPVTPPVASAPTPAAPAPAAEQWERIVSAVIDARPALGAALAHGEPIELGPQKIVIGFPENQSFYMTLVGEAEATAALKELAGRVLGAALPIELRKIAAGEVKRSVAELAAQRKNEREKELEAEAKAHPRVVEAAQIFPELGEPRVRVEIEQ